MKKIKKQKMTLGKLAVVIQQDFNDIKERLATKDELKEAVAGLATIIVGLATKGELRQLREEVINSRDEVLTSNDKIIKELKIIREEQAAHTVSYRRVDDKMEDHEARIIQLESQPSARV